MYRYQHRRVQPDIHQAVEVPGHHSQDERESGGAGKRPQQKKHHNILPVKQATMMHRNVFLYRCWLFVSCNGEKKIGVAHPLDRWENYV